MAGFLLCAGLIGSRIKPLASAIDKAELVRKVNDMAIAMNERDTDKLFENVSDNFRSPQGKDKQQLRETLTSYLKAGKVKNVRVWDISCVDPPSRDHPPARVSFTAKAEGESGRELLADCEATFDYDPDHGWRLQSIRLLKPQTTEEWSFQL